MLLATRLIVLAILTILCFPPDELQARAKSYPLLCRGGGAISGNFDIFTIRMKFVGAKQGAGARPPREGECAWLDRGFRPGEPENFVWTLKKKLLLRIDFDSEGMTKITSGNAKYDYVANSIIQGEVFQVHAYRGKCPGLKCNYLTVTRVN